MKTMKEAIKDYEMVEAEKIKSGYQALCDSVLRAFSAWGVFTLRDVCAHDDVINKPQRILGVKGHLMNMVRDGLLEWDDSGCRRFFRVKRPAYRWEVRTTYSVYPILGNISDVCAFLNEKFGDNPPESFTIERKPL